MPYTTLPSVSANKVLTASYLNSLNEDLRVISGHNHSGSAGEGASLLSAASAASPFVYRQEIVMHIAPSSQNWSIIFPAGNFFNARMDTTAAPASINFPMGLMSGSYTVTILHQKNTNSGIASLIIGGSTWGELDTYANPASDNQFSSINGYLATAGSYILQFSACGKKNALSSNSNIRPAAFKIRRTGN